MPPGEGGGGADVEDRVGLVQRIGCGQWAEGGGHSGGQRQGGGEAEAKSVSHGVLQGKPGELFCSSFITLSYLILPGDRQPSGSIRRVPRAGNPVPQSGWQCAPVSAKGGLGQSGCLAMNDSDLPLVIFTPSGKRGRFPAGTPILTVARQLGVDLDSVCGGRGICSKCQVTPSYGEFPKHGVTVAEDALNEWNEVEERYKSKRGLIEGRRLGCQAQVQGDVVIDVPPEKPGAQTGRAQTRRGARDRAWNPATQALLRRSGPSRTCTTLRVIWSG